ncbi:MAG: DUF1318 domain-containing protein [Opitutales bacterium]|nr:DUF1318 domain-containing protein [Opitutales bacterium]
MNSYKSILAALIVAIAPLAVLPSTASAQGGSIRQRMQERLPSIDSMKADGRIGENNKGYLAVRGSLSAEENQTLAAENADREEVYESIARRTGSDAESVGRERAEQIADRAAPGSWLQDQSGRWYRK